MIFEREKDLRDRIEEVTERKIRGPLIIKEDTTHYMNISSGNVLRLNGNDYYVRGDASEGRFGIDDQPKFWVKYATDLETGEKKIIKLVFQEDFTSRFGSFLVRGTRSPEKEAQVLDIVRGHGNFMQGRSGEDRIGNLVRIIDFVRGPSLYNYINRLKMDHETYFHDYLPGIMEKLLEALEAMAFLEKEGEHHGDIRTDHIIIDSNTKNYVWIDFDFKISHTDFDLWSIGGVLVSVVGKGAHTVHDVVRDPESYPVDIEKISFSPENNFLLLKNRITNLRQLFPYIPEELNQILKNFSIGTEYFYENVRSIINDLRQIYP